MIHVRPVGREEIDRIRELDVSEEGDSVYKWVDGEVVAIPEEWRRPRWDEEECRRRAGAIRGQMSEQAAVVLGAFDSRLLVGAAIFRPHLSPGVCELAGLWVSRAYRRQRVATRLVGKVEQLARRAGAGALYVSGTPSRSAVGFYRSRGFEPTLAVNRELHEREPDDIHMVLDLSARRPR